jgi:hypothetical protein
MPLLSIEAMNVSLDSDYADNDHELALFSSDPSLEDDPGGAELEALGGYGRVTIEPADWAAADAGAKELLAPAQLPSTTAEWPDAALYFGLWDTVLDCWRDFGPLAAPLEVTGAGAGPLISPVVFYDDAVSTTEG